MIGTLIANINTFCKVFLLITLLTNINLCKKMTGILSKLPSAASFRMQPSEFFYAIPASSRVHQGGYLTHPPLRHGEVESDRPAHA